MWAIIGGSGFESFDGFSTVEELDRSTPFGMASSGLRKVKMGQHEILFVSRHGKDHELMPSEVNFRANIFALKKFGARRIMSISAVGSLREELKPGDMVVPTQYIDRTKGTRKHTFCGEGLVGHVSLAHPVPSELVAVIKTLAQAKKFDFQIHFDRTHVVIEGPTFSSRAESLWYRSMGADIIGMTNYPEYALAREAGMSYLPFSFVTDYDCWKEDAPHVTLEEVLKVMRHNNQKAFTAALATLETSGTLLAEGIAQQGLATGLMTPPARRTSVQDEWLKVILA